VGLTTLPPSSAVVMKSGNLNFLETSEPLQACNGTDLPLHIDYVNHNAFALLIKLEFSILCLKLMISRNFSIIVTHNTNNIFVCFTK